ncbi:MAG: CUAEP/CCAEP-tail radical SAM protein [Planctomycetota bacterium]
MREPGQILLISCYELGHQPLGVATPMAFLRRAGFSPEALDLSVEPLDAERVKRARLAAISVPMHTALRLGVEAARRIRAANPGCVICFYGLYAQLNRKYLLEGIADLCLAGELEELLVAEAQALEKSIPENRRDERSPPLQRQQYPVPERHGLPSLERYAHLEYQGERRLAAAVEASRGCKYHCRHCPIPPVYGGRFFVVPLQVIELDVAHLVSRGVRHITFADPDFLNGPKHALRVVESLHKRFPELTFDFTSKVEHLVKHQQILSELRRCGCLFVVTAVESLSDKVLSILDKGHTRHDVFTALEVTRKAGLALRPSLVSFTPWTTLADYNEVLEVVAAQELVYQVDPIQYAIRLLVPPGSLLLEHPEMQPYLGPLDSASYSYRWKHPDSRLDALHPQVSRIVAEGAREGEDPALTFLRVRDLADSASASAPTRLEWAPPAAAYHRPLRLRPPRLTEAWFC